MVINTTKRRKKKQDDVNMKWLGTVTNRENFCEQVRFFGDNRSYEGARHTGFVSNAPG